MTKEEHTKLATLYKMVDDQTTRVRNGQQKLTDTQHATRKYYDDERAKSDMLLSLSTNQAASEAANRELLEIRSRVQHASARNDDFEKHIISQIEAAQRNEKTQPHQTSHTQQRREVLDPNHTRRTSWLGSHRRQICGLFSNKPPSNSDLAKLLELCPFTQTLNMALTIRN